MTFKNILPDQHIILKFVTQSKKKKKKRTICCQDLKGLPSEIKKKVCIYEPFFFSFWRNVAETKQILAELGGLFHLILQCSHYCSSIHALACEFCRPGCVILAFFLCLICVDGLKLKLLEGFCSLNFNPLVASNMSATMSAPHSSRGCCANPTCLRSRPWQQKWNVKWGLRGKKRFISGKKCPSFVLVEI